MCVLCTYMCVYVLAKHRYDFLYTISFIYVIYTKIKNYITAYIYIYCIHTCTKHKYRGQFSSCDEFKYDLFAFIRQKIVSINWSFAGPTVVRVLGGDGYKLPLRVMSESKLIH